MNNRRVLQLTNREISVSDNHKLEGDDPPHFEKTMFQAAVRAAVRPAAKAACSAIKSTSVTPNTAIRGFAMTCNRLSEGPAAPPLYGVGAPAGQMPTDEEQATGLERLELLGEMQGINVFDEEPLDSSRMGTLEDPVKVFSLVRLFFRHISIPFMLKDLCYLGHGAHHWLHRLPS
jgi:hypothetical protein